MRLWRWLFGRRDPPAEVELRRRTVEAMNQIEREHIRATGDIREQIAAIRARIQQDPDFPVLGDRRIVVNRRHRQ